MFIFVFSSMACLLKSEISNPSEHYLRVTGPWVNYFLYKLKLLVIVLSEVLVAFPFSTFSH